MKTQTEWHRKYRKKHPEKAAESQKRYYENNKERKLQAQREYREKNKKKIKARAAEKYKKKKDEIYNAISLYREKNPEKVKAWRHNQRVKRASCEGVLSADIASKLFIFQKGKCAVCKKRIRKLNYHIDHIIPLARGGRNVDGNVQLTCPKCNLEKGHKDPIAFMQERGFLL